MGLKPPRREVSATGLQCGHPVVPTTVTILMRDEGVSPSLSLHLSDKIISHSHLTALPFHIRFVRTVADLNAI